MLPGLLRYWFFTDCDETHLIGRQDADDPGDVASDVDVGLERRYQGPKNPSAVQRSEFDL